MSLWSVITGGITDIVGGWFKTKQEKQKLEAEITKQQITGSDDYDLQAQRNMKTSWKDEYLILVHTFLIWGYGIPSESLHKALDNVWLKLAGAPDWWWYIYAGMVISTFGLRWMSNKMLGDTSNNKR